jgi:hypothetical protein
LLCEVAQAGVKLRIDFDGVDRSAGGEEVLGHFTVTGTDFDPTMLVVAWERNGGMRRNANDASNLFAPVEIGEKVLAEALACHGGNSVAGGVRGGHGASSARTTKACFEMFLDGDGR